VLQHQGPIKIYARRGSFLEDYAYVRSKLGLLMQHPSRINSIVLYTPAQVLQDTDIVDIVGMFQEQHASIAHLQSSFNLLF
jgi:hypothetical protein